MINQIVKIIKINISVILYLFFGVCTTGINILSFYLLSKIFVQIYVSSSIAWVISVLFAYVTNKIYVFKAGSNSSVVKEAIKFFSGRIMTGLLDIAIMFVFVELIGMNAMLIKIMSNIVVVILNYFISKIAVFNK